MVFDEVPERLLMFDDDEDRGLLGQLGLASARLRRSPLLRHIF